MNKSKKLSKEEIKVLVNVIIERKDKEIKDNFEKEYKKEIEEFNVIKKEIEEKYRNLEEEYKEKLKEYKEKNIKDNNFRVYIDDLFDVRKSLKWNNGLGIREDYKGYCFDKDRNLKFDDKLRNRIYNELVLNNIKDDINIEELINEFLKKLDIK